ncbi:MAG: hypothetical protein Q7R49_01625 [Candidatus Daviesbacteria bacterium]|nr:hypothetical protein [Candidatus Daviesbacteria bacterium]
MRLERNFIEVASAGEPPYLREFLIEKDGKTYTIKLSFPGYLQDLRTRNASRPDAAKVDENIFPFADISSAEQFGKVDEGEVYQRLSQIPQDILEPYLTEQITPE